MRSGVVDFLDGSREALDLSTAEGDQPALGVRRGWRLRHWRRNLLETAARLLDQLAKRAVPPPATLAPSHPPGHFYSPVPSLDDIRAREATGFGWHEEMGGIDLNADAQIGLFKSLVQYYPEMPFGEERTGGLRYCFQNVFFGYADAIFLYSVMRHFRPRRIIEVGSGHSSCAMLDTNDLFFGGSIEFTLVEPYPGSLLSLLKPEDRRSLRLREARVQDVPLATFDALDGNDILFVDSSHVSKMGSDLNHVVFNVLPRLRPGVLVHFHDIYYPFEYPGFLAYGGIAWNEAYLLRAFLQYNRAFKILLFNTYLESFHADLVYESMPLCRRNPGGSLWLQKA